MANKPKTEAPGDDVRLDDDRLASAVRLSAQQIWQAGLGAFAKAQQEGGRAFTRLVRDGSELQKWGKLEQVFEERVARALATIGVPARTEIEELKHRMGELERMVADLAGQRAQEAVARKPAAKKAAAKRAPRAAGKSAG